LEGCPEPVVFLGPRRDLPSPRLEEFPAVIDLPSPGLVLLLRLGHELILGLPEFLLRLLGGPFAVLDRFERFLGLERALGRQTGSLLGLRLAGLDLRLVPSERRLPVGEAFGPRVEFRPLGPEVRFFLAEFACLPRPLAKLVNLVFQSGDFVLLLTDGALRLGEVRGERGFLVLAFTACGLRLASRRLGCGASSRGLSARSRGPFRVPS